MTKPRLTLLLVGLLLFAQTLYSQTNTNSEKPRIIITADPDGDQTQIKWVQLPTTSFEGDIDFLKSEGRMGEIKIPESAIPGQSVHIVAAASDQTSAPLTAYKRVIILIKTP